VEREFRQVLAQLELVSYGSTFGWDSPARDGDTSGRRPPGSDRPAHDHFRARWNDAHTDYAREKTLNAARETLHAIGHTPRVKIKEEPIAKRDARIVRDGAGIPPTDVAIAFRCGPGDVRRARLAAGRDPLHGQPLPELEHASAHEKVLTLAELGLSQRQVAERTGISQATVNRILRAATRPE
jgi:Helix-turn-helix